MGKYRLKKEAVPFFNKKLATAMHDLETWQKFGFEKSALEKIEDKLESKFLQPYYWHQLAILHDDEISKIQFLDFNIIQTQFEDIFELNKPGEFKVILRPFEDLFKVSNLQMSKNLPFEFRFENKRETLFEYLENLCKSDIGRDFLNLIKNQKEEFILEKIQHAPFSIVQKLFELHFDVFGLIKKGFAISQADAIKKLVMTQKSFIL